MKKMEEETILNSVICDEETEFKNKEFQNWCDKNNVKLYFARGDSRRLGIINRFH
jgi:hypothetical protein